MPPTRAWFAGLYALLTTLATTVGGLYAQLAGTQTSIGKGAWITAVAGAVVAAAGAVKAGWPPDLPVRAPHGRILPQTGDTEV